MDKPYDPLPDLIGYFAHSRRSCTTVRAAAAQRQLMNKLGITEAMDAAEAADRVREAIRQERDYAY